MILNTVEIMFVESLYNISIPKYEKSISNIKISKISNLPFDLFCFSLKNYDTGPNAAKINQFRDTNSRPEQRIWFDSIILKEQ